MIIVTIINIILILILLVLYLPRNLHADSLFRKALLRKLRPGRRNCTWLSLR